MLISGTALRQQVTQAIDQAARANGVDFRYLYAQARIESGLNPAAAARTSSARGLFQFIDQTWLGTVAKHGEAHGLGWAAAQIERRGGRWIVADPEARRAILNLRNDPQAASTMAGAFAADNREYLARRTGREPESVDLYLAHFLGAAGAARLLNAPPGTSAAALFPAAARANRAIFYSRDGAPRTVDEIRTRFAAKLERDTGPSSQSAPVRYAGPPTPPTAPATAPERASRLTWLMLAAESAAA